MNEKGIGSVSLTGSGGVQKEVFFWVPCMTLRGVGGGGRGSMKRAWGCGSEQIAKR